MPRKKQETAKEEVIRETPDNTEELIREINELKHWIEIWGYEGISKQNIIVNELKKRNLNPALAEKVMQYMRRYSIPFGIDSIASIINTLASGE